MSAGIFIKTWRNDLQWLKYTLASIERYGTGFDKIIIVTDKSCLSETINVVSNDVEIMAVDDWEIGYIQQQWIKLNADVYLDTEYILFVDSDCVFHTAFSPESYMKYGRPILMKTKYGNLDGAEAWKEITERFVGFNVEYEYMRRLPWMYLSSSISSFRQQYPYIHDYLAKLTTREFSEFNALGAYIDRYEPDNYFITDTEQWLPESVSRQFWSWGGVTSEVKHDIDTYLR